MGWKDELLISETEQARLKKNQKRREHYAKTKDSLKAYYEKKAENPNYNREIYAHRLATKPNYNKVRGRRNLDNQQVKWWTWVIEYIKENVETETETLIERFRKQWNLTKVVPRPLLPVTAITPIYKPRFTTKQVDEAEVTRFIDNLPKNLNVEYEYYTTTMSYDGEIVKIDDTSTPGKILVTVKRKKNEA